jgi:hypothetical protein
VAICHTWRNQQRGKRLAGRLTPGVLIGCVPGKAVKKPKRPIDPEGRPRITRMDTNAGTGCSGELTRNDASRRSLRFRARRFQPTHKGYEWNRWIAFRGPAAVFGKSAWVGFESEGATRRAASSTAALSRRTPHRMERTGRVVDRRNVELRNSGTSRENRKSGNARAATDG